MLVYTLAEIKHRFNTLLATIVAQPRQDTESYERDKTRAKTPSDYHWMKRYDVTREKLVYPLSTTTTATDVRYRWTVRRNTPSTPRYRSWWPNTHREKARENIQEHHNGSSAHRATKTRRCCSVICTIYNQWINLELITNNYSTTLKWLKKNYTECKLSYTFHNMFYSMLRIYRNIHTHDIKLLLQLSMYKTLSCATYIHVIQISVCTVKVYWAQYNMFVYS